MASFKSLLFDWPTFNRQHLIWQHKFNSSLDNYFAAKLKSFIYALRKNLNIFCLYLFKDFLYQNYTFLKPC